MCGVDEFYNKLSVPNCEVFQKSHPSEETHYLFFADDFERIILTEMSFKLLLLRQLTPLTKVSTVKAIAAATLAGRAE